MIPNHIDGCQDSGILTFINILVKLCIYPYSINHVVCIALFGKQESLESSQEFRNLAKIPKDSESRRRKSIVSDPLSITYVDVASDTGVFT